MDIKELQEKEFIESINIFSNNKEKLIDNRYITDGEVSEIKEDNIDLIDSYILNDDNSNYLKKNKISFKNYSYVILYDIVYKNKVINDIDKKYVDISNIIIYVKDIKDMESINNARKIVKSIKKTIRIFNNSLSSNITDYIDEYLGSKKADNNDKMYQLKK